MEIECKDPKCPKHGSLATRKRTFEGKVVKLFEKRAVVELERLFYIKKYERYEKRTTRLHAHVPACLKERLKIGSKVEVAECRPLSKLIHFVITNVK